MYKKRIISSSTLRSVFQERVSECSDDDDNDDCEAAFCMASLQPRGAGNDKSPAGSFVSSTAHMAYTWRDICVQTSGSNLRRRGFWALLRRESAADRQSKHILTNGDWPGFNFTSFFISSSFNRFK